MFGNCKIKRMVYLLALTSIISGCSIGAPADNKDKWDKSILNLLYEDMHGEHESKPHGVPADYSWCKGPILKSLEFPSSTYYESIGPHKWNAITIWGQVYEAAEGTGSKNTRIQIKNIDSYYLSFKDNKWHNAQAQISPTGAAYAEDFATNDTEEPTVRMESDGSISVIPGNGYNYHFYPSSRAEIDPDDVKGVCGSVNARLILDNDKLEDDRNKAKYLLNMGCDLWYDLSAPWDDFKTNGDTGIGKFRYVKKDWQSFTMYSIKEGVDIKNCPPPPITAILEKE